MTKAKDHPVLKKVRGLEVLWESERGNIVIAYNRGDAGGQYKVLCKVLYEQEDSTFAPYWVYYASFGTLSEGIRYAEKIYDYAVKR